MYVSIKVKSWLKCWKIHQSDWNFVFEGPGLWHAQKGLLSLASSMEQHNVRYSHTKPHLGAIF